MAWKVIKVPLAFCSLKQINAIGRNMFVFLRDYNRDFLFVLSIFLLLYSSAKELLILIGLKDADLF